MKFLKVLFPLIVGCIVSFIINPYMNYDELIKPILSPPKVIFPIVWTIIYLLLGISFLFINSFKSKFLYYLGIFVNALWPILFFVFRLYLFSFIWIILLFIITLLMTIFFYKENKLAAYLNYPYLIWLCFAAYLNLNVLLIN